MCFLCIALVSLKLYLILKVLEKISSCLVKFCNLHRGGGGEEPPLPIPKQSVSQLASTQLVIVIG